ncbi:VanZ family protein [Corynebacterium sp. L4756]|uniref:VanZ family protein n=1 Tax=Corynebacterium sp. L4757 TaxID=3373098 RepID=UPI00374D1893
MTPITTRPPQVIESRPPQKRPRSLAAALVIALSIVVIALVTLGKPFIDIPGVVNSSAHAIRSVDFQLFDGFDRPTYWYAPWTNSIGNVLLFMPFGAAIFARTRSFVTAVLLSLFASVGIEITQYVFALGYSDIDDVFFNTLGGVAGAGAMALLPRREHAGWMRLTAILLTILLAGMAVLGLKYHV